MNKALYLILLGITALCFTACKDKEIKPTKGVVTEMTDTTMTVKIESQKVTFNTITANYTNGLVMADDSVEVKYIGDLDDEDERPIAIVVNLKPKPGKYVKIGVDKSKKLESTPMTKEEKENLDEFVKEAEKHGTSNVK